MEGQFKLNFDSPESKKNTQVAKKEELSESKLYDDPELKKLIDDMYDSSNDNADEFNRYKKD